VLLTVRDNGRGMPPEILARIFEPFFTTKKQGKGTGLGLAVVHGIVQNHQGAIFVQSAPGQGTVFEVFLPAMTTPAIAALAAGDAGEGEAPLPRGRGEKILLVDDDATALNGLRIQMEHLGYRVTCASDPRSALELFLARPDHFDLILTDYAMSEFSGHDLAAKVFSARPGFPVILTSGLIETHQIKRARDIGIQAVIRKPVALTDLARALARQLAKNHPS
jgi:CheY-like chemotaxis protein